MHRRHFIGFFVNKIWIMHKETEQHFLNSILRCFELAIYQT